MPRWFLLVFSALVAIGGSLLIALKYRRDLKDRERKITVLEQLLGAARLDALRMQLHPHFLFNALNAISAHVERDPRTARAMLDKLGSLLRMSLEHAREQEIPLERELAFIESYVDLQKARFEDRLALMTNIAPDVLHARVPSLILQPLVENAVRHGIASGAAAGTIDIRAWRERDSLRLTVHDDGPGLPADWDPEHGFGVGLSNTRERLHRMYGGSQRFEIAGAPDGGVQVTLTLPFTTATTAGAAKTRIEADSLGS
jgi:two-component system LytT family sensor kinase